MSLDVMLHAARPIRRKGSGIFVRQDGAIHEISREEWDERNPGHEPTICEQASETTEAYSANITHNLNTMAGAAGIYEHLWRPEEIGIKHASQLIAPLRTGLEKLRADRSSFERLNPENGWGNYGTLVRFVADYLAACEEYPDAVVSTWR